MLIWAQRICLTNLFQQSFTKSHQNWQIQFMVRRMIKSLMMFWRSTLTAREKNLQSLCTKICKCLSRNHWRKTISSEPPKRKAPKVLSFFFLPILEEDLKEISKMSKEVGILFCMYVIGCNRSYFLNSILQSTPLWSTMSSQKRGIKSTIKPRKQKMLSSSPIQKLHVISYIERLKHQI